jgi:glycosyltransferase involved in cell wall biosynthesis
VRLIRVGITEKHGMAAEASQHPPSGVQYSFLSPSAPASIIRSGIKGYMGHYEANGEVDIIEAVLSPAATRDRWVYSCANFQEAAAFNILGCPLPRTMRAQYIKHLLSRDNCKKVIFWSEAGKRTLQTYGRINDPEFLRRVTVVYPAVRHVADELIQFGDGTNLLFTGDFFRKGGVNVVDAFERVQRTYPTSTLTVCCDEAIDFNTRDATLRAEYLQKLRSNKGIRLLGRVGRDELVHHILPKTDVYLLPTYVEAFGFAILEAMAFGIPVVSTNYFAIPEMIEHGVSGFLIHTSRFDCDRLFRGYVVDRLPRDFREHVTEHLFTYLSRLIESAELRRTIGLAALNTARSKFSFARRNEQMLQIYREALQPSHP